MFANNRSVKSAMGAAVQAAEKLLVRGTRSEETGSRVKRWDLVRNDLDVPSVGILQACPALPTDVH